MITSLTSRYYGLDTAAHETPDGRLVVHLRRRIVPLPDRFATLTEHVVRQHERPDHIAAEHLADPEQFWRIADANAALHPDELTETPGRSIRITLPEGVPGLPNA